MMWIILAFLGIPLWLDVIALVLPHRRRWPADGPRHRPPPAEGAS